MLNCSSNLRPKIRVYSHFYHLERKKQLKTELVCLNFIINRIASAIILTLSSDPNILIYEWGEAWYNV